MFDIGWTEIALIGGAALLIMGPDDLPRALYNLGKIVKKIRNIVSGVQKTLDDVVREAEIEDLTRDINQKIGGPNLQFEIERQIAEEDRKKRGEGKDDEKVEGER